MSGERVGKRQFASDNYAGICPEAWAALEAANRGHASAYGEDRWTEEAAERLREVFETDCEVFFVFNGTAANSLALASLCQSYHSILCHKAAHVETDECGAPEFFSNGTKVLLLEGENGKIGGGAIEEMVERWADIHYPKPRAVSLTQATEVGTVYSAEEVRRIGETCRRLGLRLHMDGARFANAVASLGVAPREITWEAGGTISRFVSRHPSVKMLALAFLILIGTALIAEGLHFEIPKGYIYFAMAFSLGVEILNIKQCGKKRAEVEG